MVQPQSTNAALQGSGMMGADEGPDEAAPENTEPETSDRNSGMFVRQLCFAPPFVGGRSLLTATRIEHRPSRS